MYRIVCSAFIDANCFVRTLDAVLQREGKAKIDARGKIGKLVSYTGISTKYGYQITIPSLRL